MGPYDTQAGLLQSAQPREQTFTERTAEALDGVIGCLNDTCQRLQITRDRTFGANAPTAAGKDALASVPNGTAGEIADKLNYATRLAYEAQALASELQRTV
jgi:hypothetical protein